jgi:ParB-like nuclease family protein
MARRLGRAEMVGLAATRPGLSIPVVPWQARAFRPGEGMLEPREMPDNALFEPLMNVVWVEPEQLTANSYNPNRVYRAEMKLLELSIMSCGWVMPILANINGMIIDGFHRWSLAQTSKKLKKKYGNLVPVGIVPVDDVMAKCITVRMNRAKGTHIAVGMADLVKQLVNDDGCEPRWVAEQIGADIHEVEVLLAESVFEIRNIKDWAYSEAWYPAKGDG